MRRVYEIFEDPSEDRYIFVQYNKGKIIGINFHQGIGHIDYNYFQPCPKLTKIYDALNYDEQELCDITQRVLVDKAIQLYIDLFHK